MLEIEKIMGTYNGTVGIKRFFANMYYRLGVPNSKGKLSRLMPSQNWPQACDIKFGLIKP